MKKSTKQPKSSPRKTARAKSPSNPSIESRGQNAAEEKIEKLSPGEQQKRRLLALPLAGQGRTVTSPTPLDE